MKEFLLILVMVFANVDGRQSFSMNLSSGEKSLRRVQSHENLKIYQQNTRRESANNFRKKLEARIENTSDSRVWNYKNSMDTSSLEKLIKELNDILSNGKGSSERSSNLKNNKRNQLFNKRIVKQLFDKLKVCSKHKWVKSCMR